MADPNYLFLKKAGVIFMFNAKCANTSMKISILNTYGITHSFPLDKLIAQYSDILTYLTKKQVIVEMDKGSPCFSFVRQPYTRILSTYHNRVVDTFDGNFRKHGIHEKMSFREFVNRISEIPDHMADQHFRSQFYDLEYQGNLLPQYIYKYEDIENGWELVRQKVRSHSGLQLGPLDVFNVSKSNSELDNITRKIIAQRYSQDFEAFEYEV